MENGELMASATVDRASGKPRRKRRLLQFGLPTLLGLVTLAAIGLAMIAGPAERAERQRRTVAEVHGLGGSVGYKLTIAGVPDWVRDLVGEDYFRTVIGVDLTNSRATDSDLEHLARLTALEWLRLDNTAVSGAGASHLKQLTSLHWLSLDNTRLHDAQLEHLKGMTRLKTLRFKNTDVSRAAIDALRPALPYTVIHGP
jgi:hypothetical protein